MRRRDSPKTVASLNSAEKELDDLGAQDVSSLGKEYGALQEKFKKDKQLEPAERARLNVLRKEMDAAQAKFEARAAAVAKNSADDPRRRNAAARKSTISAGRSRARSRRWATMRSSRSTSS